MNNSKTAKLFLAMALTGVSLTASAQSAMTVTAKGAAFETRGFLLSEVSKMTFANGVMTLKTKDGEANKFTMADVKDITFLTATTGVGTVKSVKSMLYHANDLLSADPSLISADTDAAVYSADGAVVIEQHVWDGTPISTSALPKGAYIFRVGKKSLKFFK